MSFFKKKPSPSNSASTQQQQFPSKSPSPSQQKQQPQPIYPWSAHTPSSTQSSSPFPRHAHALSTTATVAGELFLFGGYIQSTKSVINDLHMFSTRDYSTTPMKTSGQAPNRRYGHRAAFTNTTLLIWGGVSNRSDRSAENRWDDDSLYLLNLVSREWTRVVVDGPGPGSRSHHTVTLVDAKLFVFGGRTARRFFNDIWAFDLNRLTSNPVWELYEPTPGNKKPSPRSGHVSVTTGDRIIIFGGLGGDGRHFFNDTWSFNISTREWTEVKCTGSIPSPRVDHAAVLVDNVMYVFGGCTSNGTELGDLTALNLSTQRWVAFDDIGPSPSRRRAHAMATDGTRIFLLGGTLSPDSKANESKLIYVLDTKRITFPDPDFNAVNSSENATQLARESSTGPSIQGQAQQPSFSLSDSDVHPGRSNSPLKEAAPGELDHPDAPQIARERDHGSSNLPSLLLGMNDKPRHILEEGGDNECSSDYHGKLVAPDVSSEKEVTRMDYERIADLEWQLSETLTAQTGRDRYIAQLTDQLTQKSALLELSEANAAEAKKHAKQELRELQAKLHTLEQAQSALQKATSRASDADERSQPACEACAELEAKKSELEALRLRLTDAEDRCAESKEEADTLRAQATAGLINGDVDRVMHRLMERMRSMEAEMEFMRGNEKSIESMVCRNEG